VNLRLALFALALAAPSAAPAQSDDLAAARRAGQVGERFDGYLGYAVTPPANVQRQVQAINIRRRALYSDLASRRGVTPQVAALATGCELLARISVGEVYMLQDGFWHRRQAGQPAPRPDYCG
jgi:uncharacterized protein YdbL (DUF1318 family)